MQMKVIVNGKAEQREVDYIHRSHNEETHYVRREHYMPDVLVPVLFDGEELQRAIDGKCHIFRKEGTG
jgi:hypothetical protein